MMTHTRLVQSIASAVVVLITACVHDELKGPGETATPASKQEIAAIAPTSASDSATDPPMEQTAVEATRDTAPTPDRSQWRPKMPMVRVGSCPGEDCTYGGLVTACQDLPLFTSDSLGAKPSGVVIHKGDTVTISSGNLHLTEPGIVLIKRDYAVTDNVSEYDGAKTPRRDTVRFFAGDTLYVLDYAELGVWNWWYRGKPGGGDEFWTGAFQRSFDKDDDKRPAVAVSKASGEWWYKLQVDMDTPPGWVRGGRGRWVDRKFIPLGGDGSCGSEPANSEESDLKGSE